MFIIYEIAHQFSCTQIWVIKGIVPVAEGLKI